jgi:hypothetical protein
VESLNKDSSEPPWVCKQANESITHGSKIGDTLATAIVSLLAGSSFLAGSAFLLAFENLVTQHDL